MNKGLEIKYEKGVVSIIIDKATLISNVRYDLSESCGDDVVISNENKFIKSIVSILEQEMDESGKTLVHEVFSQAAMEAVEQGEEGIKFSDD